MGGGSNFLSFLFSNNLITNAELASFKPNASTNTIIAMKSLNSKPKIKAMLKKMENIPTDLFSDRQTNLALIEYEKQLVKKLEKNKPIKYDPMQQELFKNSKLTHQAQIINLTLEGHSDGVLGQCYYLLNNPNKGTGRLTLTFLKKASGIAHTTNTTGIYTYDDVPLYVWLSMTTATLKIPTNNSQYLWGAMHNFWTLYLRAFKKTEKGAALEVKRQEKIRATLTMKQEMKNKKTGQPVDYEKLGRVFMKFGETYGNPVYLKKWGLN